MQNFALLT